MISEKFATLPPTRLFFHCAVPAVITSVFGGLYSVVDGLFVGRYLGQDALAAVNLIMPVIMIVEAVSNMIATGASVNISILLGQGKREEASRVFSFSVKFSRKVSSINLCNILNTVNSRFVTDDGEFAYNGFVISKFLDNSVNKERTAFDIPESQNNLFEKITKDDIYRDYKTLGFKIFRSGYYELSII